ncbi:MAG: ABC transporter permease subunit, partial [Anaerolineaceae bacterium]|nr:ABC transporter permease subunit [Anaerolineaceae bacterium]
MDYLWSALVQALKLLGSFDREVYSAAALSLGISSAAIVMASLVGVPVGLVVGAGTFRFKPALLVVLNTLMALPTVLVGLLLYTLLSRRGPAGPLGLLYTPWAMMLGQFVLATPIIAALSVTAVHGADPRVVKSALTLGAGRFRVWMTLAGEMRLAILAAVVAAFGRVAGEVGVSMMVGGNIRHYTRNLTTAIALETSKGEIAMGIALGLILMVIALGVNAAVQVFQYRSSPWKRSLK